jgi:hypothetical protein
MTMRTSFPPCRTLGGTFAPCCPAGWLRDPRVISGTPEGPFVSDVAVVMLERRT